MTATPDPAGAGPATAVRSATVHVRSDGPVAIVTLDNPPLNLLTMDMRARLREIAAAVAADETVRAVVITAVGERSFSSGSDIREFPADAAAGRARADAEHACLDAIEALPQPTVAALRGHVLGGGLELALACDLRVASEEARIGLPEGRLGVFPSGGGTQRLPRLVGMPKAKELILLGDVITAAEALELGLVNRVVGRGAAETAARELAGRLAEQPRLAIQAAKRAIVAGQVEGVDAGREVEAREIAALFETHDAREGRAAFLEKREPRFSHR